MATQDKVLHRRCMSVPGGAVLFASINGVHLETPSALQKQRVKLVRTEGGPAGVQGGHAKSPWAWLAALRLTLPPPSWLLWLPHGRCC